MPAVETRPELPPSPERRPARYLAALSLIPYWDLRILQAASVLVVGSSALAAEVARGLLMLGVGTVRRAETRPDDPAVQTLREARLVPHGTDLVVHATGDGWYRALVRRACGRSGIPWVDVRVDVFHGALTSHLPDDHDDPSEIMPGVPPAARGPAPLNPAMAAVMGGLAAQEGAKVLLRAAGYPILRGRTCHVDGQAYSMALSDADPM